MCQLAKQEFMHNKCEICCKTENMSVLKDALIYLAYTMTNLYCFYDRYDGKYEEIRKYFTNDNYISVKVPLY